MTNNQLIAKLSLYIIIYEPFISINYSGVRKTLAVEEIRWPIKKEHQLRVELV